MKRRLLLIAAALACGLAWWALRNVHAPASKPTAAVQPAADAPGRRGPSVAPPALAASTSAPAPSIAVRPAGLTSDDARFSPQTRKLVAAVDAGQPLRLQIGAGRPRELLLTPAPFLADGFHLNIGEQPDRRQPAALRLYSGLSPATHFAVHGAGPAGGARTFEPFADVVLAVVDGAAALEISEPDGQYTQARLDPGSGAWRAVEWRTDDFAFHCTFEKGADGATLAAMQMPKHPEPGDWERRAAAAAVEPAPETDALVSEPGDRDPTTGQFNLSQQRPPWGPRYDATLKKVNFIWAVNKFNTGANTPENLAYQASFYLAFFAHSAATYEYQMGFRNLLQELILVPDDPAYQDFADSGAAGTKLDNFRVYINTHRPQGTYGWQTACGAPNYIWAGLAWLPVFPGSYSVSIADPWHYVVNMHEHGHNFAAGHTQGGIMNAYVSDSWDFHTLRDGSTNRTSAHEMYDWCLNRGSDTGVLRSPYDMPFARHDAKSTAVNTPITFDPRTNDYTKTTAQTNDNELAIEEVSTLLPPAAGAVTFTATNVTFTPAQDFQGVAWFSYTLRGNVGNSGRGYLHRATVAITVGSDTRQPYALSVPAGTAVEFVPGIRPNGIVSQPAQAVATVGVGGYGTWFYELDVRARADASGTDQFVFSSAGGNKTVDVTYVSAPGLQAHDDFLPDNSYAGGQRIAPLANDEGAGERSTAIDTRVALGVQTNGAAGAVLDVGDDHFGLAARSDLDAAKGTSFVEQVTLTGDAGAVVTNSGYLVFHRLQTGGVARIDYTAADAFGHQDGARVYMILPMVTVASPSDYPTSTVSLHEETMLVLDATTYPSADFPLTGAPTVAWARVYGPGTIAFADAAAPDTTATFSQPGTYVARVTASDNGYATWRQVRATVRAASELPVSENIGGYALRSDGPPVTTASPYSLGNLVLGVVDDGKSGLPFTSSWSQVDGPAEAVFANTNQVATTVTFPASGTYRLRLAMNDGRVRTAQDFDVLYDEDSDGDSLPDSWERAFFGDLSHQPGDNPADGDGHTLLQEFVTGSSPGDTNHLDFTSVSATSNGTVTVTWNSRQSGPGPARLYQVRESYGYYSGGATWSTNRRNLAASGDTTPLTTAWTGTNRAMRMFRVQVNGAVTVRTDRVAAVLRMPLIVGQNYISTPLAAGGGTIADLIPPGLLPGATNETAAVTASFWNPDTQSLSSPVWLSSHPSYLGWRSSGSFADANATAVDPAKGIVLTLRSAHGARTLYLPGLVPTNASSAVTVKGAGYTLAAVPYPAEVTLAASGLLAAGFQGGTSPGTSDQLWFFDETAGAFTTKVWYDTATSQWRDASSNAISAKKLTPGQPVLIRRRAAGSFTWTIQRPYASP